MSAIDPVAKWIGYIVLLLVGSGLGIVMHT